MGKDVLINSCGFGVWGGICFPEELVKWELHFPVSSWLEITLSLLMAICFHQSMWAKKAEESESKRSYSCKFTVKVTSLSPLLCYIVLYWLEAAHTHGKESHNNVRIRSLGSLRTAYTLPVMTTVHMLFGYFILMNSENYDRWVGERAVDIKHVKTWKSHLLNKMSLDYLWIGKLLKTLTVHRFVHR